MVCPPLGGAVCRDHTGVVPCSEVAVGFWPFCILLFVICPNCTCPQLFLVPYSFSVSVAGGDVCPGASPAAKGPRSQPVSKGGDPRCQPSLSYLGQTPEVGARVSTKGLGHFLQSASNTLQTKGLLPGRAGERPGGLMRPEVHPGLQILRLKKLQIHK